MIPKARVSDLENFVVSAKYVTLSQAAIALGIAQPSLSESILRLESLLGYKVYFRTQKGIALTPEGRAALQRSEFALNSLSLVCNNDSSQAHAMPQGTMKRTVTLGCHPVVGSYMLPKALRSLSISEPYLEVRLVHGISREIQSQVQLGQIDLAIVINALRSRDLVIKANAKDVFGVWRFKGEFDSRRVVLDPRLHQSQILLRKWKKPAIRFVETQNLELAARLVAQGVGYGFLPERLVTLLGLPIVQVGASPTVKDEISVIHRPEFGRMGYEKKLISALETAFI